MTDPNEVPQPHYDAQGDWVGPGLWTNYAGAALSSVFVEMGLSSNED